MRKLMLCVLLVMLMSVAFTSPNAYADEVEADLTGKVVDGTLIENTYISLSGTRLVREEAKSVYFSRAVTFSDKSIIDNILIKVDNKEVFYNSRDEVNNVVISVSKSPIRISLDDFNIAENNTVVYVKMYLTLKEEMVPIKALPSNLSYDKKGKSINYSMTYITSGIGVKEGIIDYIFVERFFDNIKASREDVNSISVEGIESERATFTIYKGTSAIKVRLPQIDKNAEIKLDLSMNMENKASFEEPDLDGPPSELNFLLLSIIIPLLAFLIYNVRGLPSPGMFYVGSLSEDDEEFEETDPSEFEKSPKEKAEEESVESIDKLGRDEFEEVRGGGITQESEEDKDIKKIKEKVKKAKEEKKKKQKEKEPSYDTDKSIEEMDDEEFEEVSLGESDNNKPEKGTNEGKTKATDDDKPAMFVEKDDENQKESGEEEEEKFVCKSSGCEKEFDTEQDRKIHKAKVHQEDEDEDLAELADEIDKEISSPLDKEAGREKDKDEDEDEGDFNEINV